MFMDKLKNVVGFGLVLCIMGTLLLSAPVTVLAADIDITPFCILDPCKNGGDD